MERTEEAGVPPPAGRLGTAWERRTTWTARVAGLLAFVTLAALMVPTRPAGMPPALSLFFAGVVAYLVYFALTRKVRRRRAILARPFPGEWEAVLQREVVFFRTLDEVDRVRFRREIQVFLGEKRITGIKTELDDTTRVLAAASAVIPIFGFPEWEWDEISEVLIYPSRFGPDFQFDDAADARTLGMVGTGFMNRLMVLSKPDLITGFRNAGDRRNVGIHEFAHLVDKSDGTIDGRPEVGLERGALGPWLELVRRKMEEIRRGDSDIDPYALTNEAEFFAVSAEYFFERPGVMRAKHPELYAMLAEIFDQDLGRRTKRIVRAIREGRPRFGRNSPCPCGSGKKFKKCCLRKRGR